ncbi:CD225/dispanin family protein [Antribacter sp. KLBMP9083]|uniref:CD225/dispanin family protein n=1 Tax=Antribacter soli TaxID=2910976 RepID=A0AA41Q9X7_9MICO|nr:CD225/dispanin family protein [Antribacter soli]MCF4119568.1 CD225/dispanin family protein [Antribacter soli]
MSQPVPVDLPPGYIAVPAEVTPPRTHLALAVVATVLFWPLGLVALVSAARVGPLWNAGKLAGARVASARARGWSLAAIVAGLLVAAVMLLLTARSLGVSG